MWLKLVKIVYSISYKSLYSLILPSKFVLYNLISFIAIILILFKFLVSNFRQMWNKVFLDKKYKLKFSKIVYEQRVEKKTISPLNADILNSGEYFALIFFFFPIKIYTPSVCLTLVGDIYFQKNSKNYVKTVAKRNLVSLGIMEGYFFA